MGKKLAVICPIGTTGNVVTMTLNDILRSEEVNEYSEIAIIVPHTRVTVFSGDMTKKDGKDRWKRPIITASGISEDGELQKQWKSGSWKGKVWSGQGYKWHPKIDGLNHPDYDGDELPIIKKDVACYLIPIHPKKNDTIMISKIVDDISDKSSNEQFQGLVYGLCAVLGRFGYDIHISLAGGRKTMSAYQMTAATLFSIDKEISHVLEPTMEGLEAFAKKYKLQINKKVLENVQKAYQPYPDLYESVSVEHISFADISEVIANQIGFSGSVNNLIGKLSGTGLKEIFENDDDRRLIYNIGEVYRRNLSNIDKKVTEKIQQGIYGGMLRSLITHEVRSPIFQRIEDDIRQIGKKRDRRERKKVLDSVLYQVSLLNNTISAIKNATSLSPQEIREKKVDGSSPEKVKDIIKMTLDMYGLEKLLSKYNIISELNLSQAMIKCDKALLALAFNNIVRNFWKVIKNLEKAKRKDKYNIKITVCKDQDTVTIRFVDNGPGFSKDKELDKLFDLGVTDFADDGESQGLGLAVVKKIITSHGGDIRAERNKPTGAIFEVRLPAA